MKTLNNYISEAIKLGKNTKFDVQVNRKACAFNNYADVPQDMIDAFWNQKQYADKLIDISEIRNDWKPAYETAKKNVAMLDYAMGSYYSVYFDKDANLTITINISGSYSQQNHLHHYADKCRKYFTLDTAAFMHIDKDKLELLYDGRKK